MISASVTKALKNVFNVKTQSRMVKPSENTNAPAQEDDHESESEV